jgi:hypothetical protein
MASVEGALVKRSRLALVRLCLSRQTWLLVYAAACLSLLYWPWNLLLILVGCGCWLRGGKRKQKQRERRRDTGAPREDNNQGVCSAGLNRAAARRRRRRS